MPLFENRSISSLLARSFESISEAYEALDRGSSYAEFACTNDEVFQNSRSTALMEELEGLPVEILGGSNTVSRLLSLQYAYLLTRYAEKEASENHLERALIILVEASYYSGFAQGLGEILNRKNSAPDPSLSASHAALSKSEKRSKPVKERLLELLESDPQKEKSKNIEAAIRPFQTSLEECIQTNELGLLYHNLPRTVAAWCKKDAEFREKLSRFIKLGN